MILTHMIDIDETLKLTQGQGHKVKRKGHICIYVKLLSKGKKLRSPHATANSLIASLA